VLLGRNGTRVVQVDVAGQVLRNLEAPIAPVAGDNVVLTIDTRLQKIAEASLTEEITTGTSFLTPFVSRVVL
jgi:penicillin-binding protein 2